MNQLIDVCHDNKKSHYRIIIILNRIERIYLINIIEKKHKSWKLYYNVIGWNTYISYADINEIFRLNV